MPTSKFMNREIAREEAEEQMNAEIQQGIADRNRLIDALGQEKVALHRTIHELTLENGQLRYEVNLLRLQLEKDENE